MNRVYPAALDISFQSVITYYAATGRTQLRFKFSETDRAVLLPGDIEIQ